MKDLKRQELIRLLNAAGFYSDSRGKHEIFKDANGTRIPVPQHKVISPGTMRDIKRVLKSVNINL